MAKTEIILNLAWMLVCVSALGAQVWMDRVRSGTGFASFRLRRTLSVLIAALALFPVISASDDRVRLADLSGTATQQTAIESGHFRNVANATPFEDPEHGQTATPVVFAAIVCLFLIARPETAALPRWFRVSAVGRAPPAFA